MSRARSCAGMSPPETSVALRSRSRGGARSFVPSFIGAPKRVHALGRLHENAATTRPTRPNARTSNPTECAHEFASTAPGARYSAVHHGAHRDPLAQDE